MVNAVRKMSIQAALEEALTDSAGPVYFVIASSSVPFFPDSTTNDRAVNFPMVMPEIPQHRPNNLRV
jgi:hypothetical protein